MGRAAHLVTAEQQSYTALSLLVISHGHFLRQLSMSISGARVGQLRVQV